MKVENPGDGDPWSKDLESEEEVVIFDNEFEAFSQRVFDYLDDRYHTYPKIFPTVPISGVEEVKMAEQTYDAETDYDDSGIPIGKQVI